MLISSHYVFILKMLSVFFMCAAYTQVHLRLDFLMQTNNMNPDQTALEEQSDLGPYCLKYRLPKSISRPMEQTTKDDVTGGLRIK